MVRFFNLRLMIIKWRNTLKWVNEMKRLYEVVQRLSWVVSVHDHLQNSIESIVSVTHTHEFVRTNACICSSSYSKNMIQKVTNHSMILKYLRNNPSRRLAISCFMVSFQQQMSFERPTMRIVNSLQIQALSRHDFLPTPLREQQRITCWVCWVCGCFARLPDRFGARIGILLLS